MVNFASFLIDGARTEDDVYRNRNHKDWCDKIQYIDFTEVKPHIITVSSRQLMLLHHLLIHTNMYVSVVQLIP